MVKAVFETIHGALDDDTFERSVVARRFMMCKTSHAVFQLAQELIAVGEKRGYMGTSWERAKNTILEHAGSRLLDLKEFPWREGTRETGKITTAEIAGEDSTRARQDLLKEWITAIGRDDWDQLLDLVRQHPTA